MFRSKNKFFALLLIASLIAAVACTMEAPKAAEQPNQPNRLLLPKRPRRKQPAAETPAKVEGRIKMKIGIMTMGLSQPYFVSLSKGYKDMAAEYPGVDVEIVEVDPKLDVANQVSGVESMVSLGVDAMIVTAMDPKAIDPAIADAMKEGVKVISHYNKLGAQDIHSGISTSRYGICCRTGSSEMDQRKAWRNSQSCASGLGQDRI